jgi:glycogen synthase
MNQDFSWKHSGAEYQKLYKWKKEKYE